MQILKFIFDFIAPKKCYSCKKHWKFLCEDCLKIFYDFEEICYVCKNFSKNFEVHESCKKENTVFYDKILVLKHYKNKTIQKLIKDWKFYWKREILEEFWYYLYEKFIRNEKIRKLEDFLVVSIPSYFLRKWKRWYNSSEVLAKSFAKFSKINYKKNILKKVKQTKQQSKLTREQRLVNLKDSFKINKKYLNQIKDKKIIIVDDVISTWTTINEVSKILKESWASKIIWLIIASD